MTYESMHVTTHGTRGSIAVAGPQYAHFGGNTTCLRIHSPLLPEKVALVIDSGSGYRQAAGEIIGEGIMDIALVQTHYHWDHICGHPFAPHTFVKGARQHIWGIEEHRCGPKQVFETQMQEPFFPVNLERAEGENIWHPLENIGTRALIFHPVGGVRLEKIEGLRKADKEQGQIHFHENLLGERGSFPISECLVITMYRTNHPEQTISYRIEERTTGRIFVFLTDHETAMGWADDLVGHINGAHLLIQDAQYSTDEYLGRGAHKISKVGWGHGTPEYAVRTAIRCGVERLGLTHHDPAASDDDVYARLAEAHAHAEHERDEGAASWGGDIKEAIFACCDGETIAV